jgi:hypothetical protein
MGCSCLKNDLKLNELNITEENTKEENIKVENNINFPNTKVIYKPEKIITNTILNSSQNTILKSRVISPIENKQQEVNIIKNNNSNNGNNSMNEIKKESNYLTKNIFNKRVFEIINKIRMNPIAYSQFIVENIKNISIENCEETNEKTGMKDVKQVIIFKKKVKVKLFKGEDEFIETAKLLTKMSPMEPLQFNEDIIMPIPDSFEVMNDIDFIKNKIIKSNINIFFKSNIKNPEIAVLLMIVDDNESSEKKKRNAILNKEFKYIGIDSKFINNKFVSYFTFSK